MSNLKILSACGGLTGPTYVDDVFSAYTYAGNGTSQSINNGIDLAGKGGLVWIKARNAAYYNCLWDTQRGIGYVIIADSTSAQVANGLSSVSTSGFSVSGNAASNNLSTSAYASWTFRKAPKFFDVVTWTGNATNRTIAHSLGQEVGLILVKRTDTTADWQVYHRSLANTEYMILNTTAAKATGATRWNSTTATTSVFSLGTDASANASGGTYVAYVFAHDTGVDGLIQCGSFTTDGSGNATVTLGWEPQFVLVKSTNFTDSWYLLDISRGLSQTQTKTLLANTSGAESTHTYGYCAPTATGFTTANTGLFTASQTFIYMAIRRPNKPPTVGTQVYNALARTGTGTASLVITGVGFAPDLITQCVRSGTTSGFYWWDKLRGSERQIGSPTTTEEVAGGGYGVNEFQPNGYKQGSADNAYWNSASYTVVNHFFKRAPGVFDEVCYSGTGSNKTESHNLTVAPEFWIVKGRSGATAWAAGCTALANTEYLVPNTTAAKASGATYWNSTFPTSSVFSVGTAGNVNTSTASYVAYLFATKAGISKVGSYTGNGSSQTINCGFTTGSRFILIKRTDAAGDWFTFDTVRGIVAGNDPHLSLNTTATEVTTDDSIDTDSTGFIVNQVAATNINVNAATYIYMSFA